MAGHIVAFLVFPGVKQLDVAGPAEVFAEATRLGGDYELEYCSPTGGPVRTSIGTSITTVAASDVIRADTVVIAGGDALPVDPIPLELRAATEHLVGVGERVASVCTGALLLAHVGALDGRRATTHWAHAALLARIHPKVDVSPDALFVHDGKFHTSAGVSAGIDLALSLVEADHGPDLARTVAQQLVVYMQRPGGQSQFSSLLDISRGAQMGVRHVAETIMASPAEPHEMTDLAAIAGVSPRHLTRMFLAEIGMTPVKFVQQVRVETAKSLLLRGESVAATARRAGFSNAETMRRVFTSRLGIPPNVYKQQFLSADD
jgi:transcriptional regulator GlxA family with amidase domain